MSHEKPRMPSDVTPGLSLFDRFASAAAVFVARAWFFAACVLLIVIWAPPYFVVGRLDIWQLIINTATTIVTFLLVALLQNTQSRADKALQHKLNAVAAALAALMDHLAEPEADLHHKVRELRKAVGLEERESA